jgi:hypothetical protein
MVCGHCHEDGVGQFCGNCGRVMSTAETGNALTWPFSQRAWANSIWMPMIWGVPFVGNSLALGWAIEAIRRRATKKAHLLPQFEDGASILARGFVVFGFMVLYFVIPLAIMAWLLGWSWLLPICELVHLLWKIFTGEAHESVTSFLLRNAIGFLADAATPLIYVTVMGPLFLVARVRFAVTGNPFSFLRLFKNAWFSLRHIGEILLYFLRAYLLRAALSFVAVFLLPLPIIGQLLPYAFFGLSVWANAYWTAPMAALLMEETRRDRS